MTARTSLVIVGGGIAGLTATIAAVEHGIDAVLVDDGGLERSASVQAQGGFSAVTAQGIALGDSVASHVTDTLEAGARHGDAAVIAAICAAASGYVDTLTRWDTRWDVNADGTPALTREAAHAASRILHCGGDATGAGIVRALSARVQDLAASGRIRVLAFARAEALIIESGRVIGVKVTHGHSPESPLVHAEKFTADAVLLASGGISGVFETRTSQFANPGDAAALAWRAGAIIADAEMVQFHPTFAPDAGFMITEALRGEGAVLRDARGLRFMVPLDERAELAPRDIVARGVAGAEGGAWLDAAPVLAREGAGVLARRFPTVTAALAKAGLDLEREPVRVRAAEHYWMGGIAVDANARSTVPGLLVAGEASRTGFHGANRLASNSLLEAVHSGLAAVRTVVAGWHREPGTPVVGRAEQISLPTTCSVSRDAVRHAADAHLGVHRDESGLRQLLSVVSEFAQPAGAGISSEAVVASLIATSALARRESLGAHHRTDVDAGLPSRPGLTIAVQNARPEVTPERVESAQAHRALHTSLTRHPEEALA